MSRVPLKLRLTCLMLTLVLLAMTGLTGCGPKATGPSEGGIATFRLSGDFAGLSPLANTDGNTYQVWAFLAEALIQHTPDNGWQGKLAESWTLSPDGKVYTFNLRKNVKWHDGQPFDADDVMFTWELQWDPTISEENQYTWIINGKKCEMVKIDQYKVELRLPEPSPSILEDLKWLVIVPKHILASVPRNEIKTCAWSQAPIFTGPFKFVENRTGEYLKLARFDDYWGGKPYLEQVVFRVLSDENAATVAVETGQLDWTKVTPAAYNKLKTGSKVTLQQEVSGRVLLAQYKDGNPKFDDVKVRQALSHLMDREKYANQIMAGLVKPAYNVMVPGDLYYTNDIPKYELNPEKAKALMLEAGYKMGSDGFLTKNGKVFELEFMYQGGDPLTEQAALVMQSDFAKAGIKLSLRTVERTALLNAMYSEEKDAYDIVLNGNLMGPDPQRYSYIYGKRTPELTELFAKGQTETDTTKRAEIFRQIQVKIAEGVYNIPLWYPDTLFAHNPKLHVEDASVTGGVFHFYNPEKIWLAK